VAAGESAQEYGQLLALVSDSYQPANAHERFLVGRIAELHWRLVRLGKHENAVLSKSKAMAVAGHGSNTKRTSKYMPNGVGADEIASMKYERHLYTTINELRAEYYLARAMRINRERAMEHGRVMVLSERSK
jgi:hypothetical protein